MSCALNFQKSPTLNTGASAAVLTSCAIAKVEPAMVSATIKGEKMSLNRLQYIRTLLSSNPAPFNLNRNTDPNSQVVFTIGSVRLRSRAGIDIRTLVARRPVVHNLCRLQVKVSWEG